MAAYPQKPKQARTVQRGLGIRAAFSFSEGIAGSNIAATYDIASKVKATLGGSGFIAPSWTASPYGPALTFGGSCGLLPAYTPAITGPWSAFFLVLVPGDCHLYGTPATTNAQISVATNVLQWTNNGGVVSNLSGALTLSSFSILGVTYDGATLRGWQNATNTGSASRVNQNLASNQIIAYTTMSNLQMAGYYVADKCWDQSTIQRLVNDFWFPLRTDNTVELAAVVAAAGHAFKPAWGVRASEILAGGLAA